MDIDGVLNSYFFTKRIIKFNKKHLDEGRTWENEIPGRSVFIDRKAVNRVINICKKTDAKVIISSSWRGWTLKDTINDFNNYCDLKPLLPYIVGVTPRSMAYSENICRGEEIKRFLSNNPCDKYVIIDDDSDMLDEQLENFIQTKYLYGLNDTIKKQVITHLNS